MEKHANHAQRLFYVGLLIVLATTILSAVWPIAGAGWTIMLTGVGALVTLVGRLWLSRLQRLVRHRNTDLGNWAIR